MLRSRCLLPFLLCALAGCLWSDQSERTGLLNRPPATLLPNHALLSVALLEKPIGDEYINERIWKHADELLVDSDRRDALAANGIRIGQLVGPTPEGFQQLLVSKRCCINPQAMIFPAGSPKPIYLGGTVPHATFDLVRGSERSEVLVDQARFALDVTADFTADGTRLTFTPRVETGEMILPFVPLPERSGWQKRVDRAFKSYPELSWEVTLGPNQYFIAGARLERERSLGQTAFTETRGDRVAQWLLVVRNTRAITTVEAQQASADDLIRADKSAPLALQATIPVTRGLSER